nr:MarR family transcriptional regulator [Bacillus piscicola]
MLRAIDESLFDLFLKIDEEFGGYYIDVPERYRFVLIVISKYESLYVKDLARLLHASPSSVSQLLSKMEKENYIVRELDVEKRRQTFVRLGEKGRDVLESMEKTRNEISSKYLLKLSREDLTAFHEIALKLKTIVDAERKSSTESHS